MKFQWIPGQGPNTDSLVRLEKTFSRPSEPMGGAWVMSGERRSFKRFSQLEVADVEAAEISEILTEITGAISSFGRQKEWVAWFHYLLPRATRRAFDPTRGSSFLIESVVSSVVANYPGRIEETYRGFRGDLIHTVGRAIMASDLWSDGRIRLAEVLCKEPESPGQPWGWYAPSRDLSASMCFCLKYLDTEALGPWVESWMAIDDPHWRTQILAWLITFYRWLDSGIEQPKELDRLDPSPSWEGSELLGGCYSESGCEPIPFLSDQTVKVFLDLIQQRFDEDLVLLWADTFDDTASLELEAYQLPDQFLTLHHQTR